MVYDGPGVALGARAGAESLPVELVVCGQPIDHSLRFANSLRGCPGNGVVMARDDTVIDLGGHRISGSGVGNGIDNSGGHRGVVISDGIVSEFDIGVLLVSAGRGTIEGIQALDLAPSESGYGRRFRSVGAGRCSPKPQYLGQG